MGCRQTRDVKIIRVQTFKTQPSFEEKCVEYEFPNTEWRIRIPFPTSYDPCIYTKMNLKPPTNGKPNVIQSKFIEKFKTNNESSNSKAAQSPNLKLNLKEKMMALQLERKTQMRDDDPIVKYCRRKQEEFAQKEKQNENEEKSGSISSNKPEIITRSNIVTPLIAFSQSKN